MPPRKPTKRKMSQASDHDEDDDEDYRKKRDRNNEAVKKSRFKSKQKAQETIERIDALKEENDELEDKVKAKAKELAILKELFIANCAAKSDGKKMEVDLEELLREDDDERELKKKI